MKKVLDNFIQQQKIQSARFIAELSSFSTPLHNPEIISLPKPNVIRWIVINPVHVPAGRIKYLQID